MPRILWVASGENIRELGGYPVAGGGQTCAHRFLRSGHTSDLTPRDLRYLRRYGVGSVLDLRSAAEVRSHPDPYAQMRGVAYRNVSFYDYDLHDPALATGEMDEDTLAGFLTSGYLDMLATTEAVREIFAFLAEGARRGSCVLFHCTAGMDRTGVTSMLVLALAGVDRAHIVADYAYSYEDPAEVDGWVFAGKGPSADIDPHIYEAATQVMAAVYDRVCEVYGDVPSYLRSCGVPDADLAAVRAHLL
ncbi:MAG: tyrosine-protein phosphatase [Olegusella sp.]|nr:tyrosine-protein phosphatase [Olegusella sp.]